MLYNVDQKNAFLGSYKEEGTRDTYRRILGQIGMYEYKVNRDLSTFNAKEIGDMISFTKPISLSMARLVGNVASAYLWWCVDQSIIKFNTLNQVGQEWYYMFPIRRAKRYLTEEEFVQLENFCRNAQDRVIYRLLFEGVMGKGCSEILNLRITDVRGNKLHLRETEVDGTLIRERVIEVSAQCIDAIKKAHKQKRYLKRNGFIKSESGSRLNEYFDLIEGEHIVRPTMAKNEGAGNGGVSKETLYKRVNLIKKQLEYPDLTINTIRRSGMFKMAKELYDVSGKLDKEELEKIGKAFDVKHIFTFREYLTEETLIDLYREDDQGLDLKLEQHGSMVNLKCEASDDFGVGVNRIIEMARMQLGEISQ